MTTILIIIGIVAVILFISAMSKGEQNQNKSELQDLLAKMHEEIFPNGKKDIDDGTNELLRILNHSIDEKTAQDIFTKSASICHLSTMKGGFTKERLKQHLSPYALQHFNENTLSKFYDYVLSKNEKASALNNLVEITREFSKASNPDGTDKDEMPEGYGEFGLIINNPIPTSSIPDSYFYLRRLRTLNGSEVTFDRIGSMNAENIKHTIDGYNLSANGKKIATVYICPYNKNQHKKHQKVSN
ncbi:MAG: hypothetical protein IPL74_02730 [Bacteroidetes bacterium]|nr:hypothetical protein [Bacteroidota bacterium]